MEIQSITSCSNNLDTGTSITTPYSIPFGFEEKECDCDERCDKCGRKKKIRTRPIWRWDEPRITYIKT